MAIDIDDPETEMLLQEIASMTGQDIEEILLDLLRQEALRLRLAPEEVVDRVRATINEADGHH
jgi:hypothetical protein